MTVAKDEMMNVAEILKIAMLVYLFCVGLWFSTAQAKFASSSKARPLLFMMVGASVVTTFLTIFTTVPVAVPLVRILISAVMTSVTVALIKWAFRSIHKKNLGLAFSGIVPDEVVQHGPYRYVRHPLYLAYSIFWMSCAVLSASIFVALSAACVIALYYSAARSEERDLMGSDLGPTYQSYRQRTGLIVPRLF